MKKLIATMAFLMSLFLCPVAAHAANFIFVRPGDPDRIFKQDEALVIELPSNLSEGELGSLFLELDGIDVTQRVSLEGIRAVFYPASPYAAGTHTLRLVRMGKNGKLIEINRWNFNVAGGVPPIESQSSVSGNIDATYSYRVWDNYDDGAKEPDMSNLAAQGYLEAATQQDGWRIAFKGNGFANTDDDFNPSGDQLEVGEYLLSAENTGQVFATNFNLGSHDIGARNLLMDQFYRRGISGTLDWMQGRTRVTGFSMNPAPATGNHNIFGLQKSRQLASGLHATFQPISMLRDYLEFETTAYRGEGDMNGSGSVADTSIVNEGDGYQLGLKSQLIKNILGMRAQYARADFDDDGIRAGRDSQRDEAYGLTFQVNPLSNQTDDQGRFLQWEIQPGYYRAGTYFQSLLNPSAERDREIWNIKNNLIYGNLSLDGEVSWIQDNVNDVFGMPHDGSLQIWAQGSYAPESEMWGTPVFYLGGSFSDDKRLSAPAGFIGLDLDRQMWSGNIGTTLSFEKTTWSINHTYTTLNDGADPTADYNMHYTDLGLEYRISERLTLRPGLQAEFLHENIDGSSTSVHGSMGVQAIIIPDKLWNNSSVSMLINNGENPNGRTYNAETEFNWLLKQADINSPGYALAFSGHYDNVTDTWDTTDPEEEDLRFFVRLKLSMPFSKP